MSKDFLRIILIDDEEIIHNTIGEYLRDSGHSVQSVYDGDSAYTNISEGEYDLALVDIKMPGLDGLNLLQKLQTTCPLLPVVLITGHGTMDTVIEGLRRGAADFLPKPIKLLELDAVVEKSRQISNLRREKLHLQETIRGIQTAYNLHTGNCKFVGVSPFSCKVREQIQQAVNAGCSTIMIVGETGTGKEVVARQLHQQAGVEDSPFIAVSCPALPESLLESELFGHAKGTFTGAVNNRAGYFELADGGTLLLDEIADLSAAAQATLLRILETRTLRRVGGSREIKVNVRLVAATNAPLQELVVAKKFRQDLYYRLNVYTIELAPLREHPRDIMPLAEHFMQVYSSSSKIRFHGFSSQAQELLLNYHYPGNVRELRNIIELALIRCGGKRIEPEHLRLDNSMRPELPAAQMTDNTLRQTILKALADAKWNRKKAAKLLNMPYSTLRYKIKTLGIQ